MCNLAIYIPTYNRADSVLHFIKKNIDVLVENNIDLIIADSSDNDETKNRLNDYLKDYHNIFYTSFDSSIKPDVKVYNSFCDYLKGYDYVWLCGDTCILKLNIVIENVKALMEARFDIIHLDDIDFYHLGNKEYRIAEQLFEDCFWRITLYGATIISKRVFPYIQNKRLLKKYEGTFFFYQCAIMEFCAAEVFNSIHINADFKNTYEKKKGSVWSRYVIEQFCKLWFIAIDNLPSVYDKKKKNVLKSHSHIYGLFRFKNLLQMRASGILNFKVVNENRYYIKMTVETKLLVFYFVTFIPRWFLNILYRFKDRLKKKGD